MTPDEFPADVRSAIDGAGVHLSPTFSIKRLPASKLSPSAMLGDPRKWGSCPGCGLQTLMRSASWRGKNYLIGRCAACDTLCWCEISGEAMSKTYTPEIITHPQDDFSFRILGQKPQEDSSYHDGGMRRRRGPSAAEAFGLFEVKPHASSSFAIDDMRRLGGRRSVVVDNESVTIGRHRFLFDKGLDNDGHSVSSIATFSNARDVEGVLTADITDISGETHTWA